MTRPALSAFEVTVHARTRLRLPPEGLGPDDRVALESGPGDLLELRHAPKRRGGSEPVHENLFVELAEPLPDVAPALLRAARVVYRAGTDRLTYQATRALGTAILVRVTAGARDVELALVMEPSLDLEHAGPRELRGTIALPRG